MKYPVDVSIYLDQIKNSIIDMAWPHALEDVGIEDFEMFNKFLFEEIEMCALNNFIECEDPTLDTAQLRGCIRKTFVQHHINLLLEGLLESIYNDSDRAIKYRLSNKDLAAQANLNYN